MDVTKYFESLALELSSLRDRVRDLIADRHWQTDGEWKESVIRQVLRRHLPARAVVGRGFVITNESATTQLDVLIHDASKPVLFRDGDLAFVTPDAVLGIIEVKSRLTPAMFGDAAKRMGRNIELIRTHPNINAFAAVFSFEAGGGTSEQYLQRVVNAAENSDQVLACAALGESRFLRYWEFDPRNEKRQYDTWHAYQMPQLAPGYFVHNVVDFISPESVFSNDRVWFPSGGKEQFFDGAKSATARVRPTRVRKNA